MRNVPPAEAHSSRERYVALYGRYRRAIPETFDLGADVLDARARHTGAPSLIREKAVGASWTDTDTARLTDMAVPMTSTGQIRRPREDRELAEAGNRP